MPPAACRDHRHDPSGGPSRADAGRVHRGKPVFPASLQPAVDVLAGPRFSATETEVADGQARVSGPPGAPQLARPRPRSRLALHLVQADRAFGGAESLVGRGVRHTRAGRPPMVGRSVDLIREGGGTSPGRLLLRARSVRFEIGQGLQLRVQCWSLCTWPGRTLLQTLA